MKWKIAEGNPPPPVGDCRKLVWLVDKDNMGWVGIRAYHHGQGAWWINAVNGGREESATVTHWMDLPQQPAYAEVEAPPAKPADTPKLEDLCPYHDLGMEGAECAGGFCSETAKPAETRK